MEPFRPILALRAQTLLGTQWKEGSAHSGAELMTGRMAGRGQRGEPTRAGSPPTFMTPNTLSFAKGMYDSALR